MSASSNIPIVSSSRYITIVSIEYTHASHLHPEKSERPKSAPANDGICPSRGPHSEKSRPFPGKALVYSAFFGCDSAPTSPSLGTSDHRSGGRPAPVCCEL